MSITYIHYRHDKFCPDKLKDKTECKYPRTDKPEGIWASPINAEWGWKDWCLSESYHPERLNKSFTFKLRPKARILHIHSLNDATPYLYVKDRFMSLVDYGLDLKKIYSNFDGMELHISDNYNELHNHNVFSTWDVDSICIWNPEIIDAN